MNATEQKHTAGQPIPYAYHGILDLLQNLADPARDPNDDIADGITLMDYWRRDAVRLLPSLKAGEIAIDEEFNKLLQEASWEAYRLRNIRTEYRSPSANFPTMQPVPWAQDAANVIDAIIDAVRARAAKAKGAAS